MGRKIPVRKHRGVKDPLIQLARRNACPTINAAPSNANEQELPKSLVEIQRLCALAERERKPGEGRKKRSSRYDPIDSLYLYDKDPKLPGMRRKDRGVPRIVQGSDEPDESFVHRFTVAAQEFMNEVELENKFDAKLSRSKVKSKGKAEAGCIDDEKTSDEEQTEVNDSKRRKHQPEDDFTDPNSSAKRGRINRNNVFVERATKPNKRQRKKLRLAKIKKEEHHEDEQEPSEEEIDFSSFKDEVKFGEVVHRPPQFSAKPRGSELSSKPGTKDLLLKRIMTGTKTKVKTLPVNTISNAKKHFLEKERIRVVQAYRDLKARKINSTFT